MTQVVRLCLVLLVLSGLLPQRGQAASYLAGELTYEDISFATSSQNRYLVRMRLFRDCAGASFNQTETLSCRVGSPQAACASTDPRNFTATFSRVNLTTGTPYCVISPNPLVNQCNPNAPFNYEIAIYEATVVLPPAPQWTLSWEGNTRAGLGNIPNAESQPLRLEATLRNELRLADGSTRAIVNTSGLYQNQDLSAMITWPNTRTTFNFSTYEPDGDSLVYSLEAPLTGCNQSATYQTFAVGGQLPVPTAADPTCLATLPAGSPITYSPRFPLPSFALTGSCPQQTATPNWTFNAALGSFTFSAVGYFPENTLADRARNRYAVVGKVTEYRRIGNQYYEVGSIARNIVVAIINMQLLQFPNHATRLDPTKLVNGQAQPTPDTVRVAQGQTVRVVLTATDPDGAHQIRFAVSPAFPSYPYQLPAGAYQTNTTTPGRMELTLTAPSTMPLGDYTIPFFGESNTCPVMERFNAFTTFRVVAQALSATGPVQPLLTTAAPNPFTDAVTLRVSRLTVPTRLTITNVLGQVVTELPLRPTATGTAEVTWRVTEPLPTGVYLARVAGTGQTLRLLHR